MFLEDRLNGDSPYCSSEEKERNNDRGWLSLIKFVNPRSNIPHHKIPVHLVNEIDFQVKNAFLEDKLKDPVCSSYGSPGK